MENDVGNKPIIAQLNGPSDLIPLVSTFADLSAGTEFASYKESQWRFLLGGQDITGFAIPSDAASYESKCASAVALEGVSSFDGCVLRVQLNNDSIGFGMVLVRPSQRGKGLARALIEKAMQTQAEREDTKRMVLAVCSSLGQPLYRKLGFKDAGTVTLLTCTISNLLGSTCKQWENEYLLVKDGKDITNEHISLISKLDKKSTGIQREDRIRLILSGYAEGSCSTVAILDPTTCGGISRDAGLKAFAIARQDCISGPLSIGPIIAKEECCIPLMHALTEKHFANQDMRQIGDIQIMIMITDRPNLVTCLLKVEGMNKVWECPAMTSDGKPVYNGDGSYLAMMHPTLG